MNTAPTITSPRPFIIGKTCDPNAPRVVKRGTCHIIEADGPFEAFSRVSWMLEAGAVYSVLDRQAGNLYEYVATFDESGELMFPPVFCENLLPRVK